MPATAPPKPATVELLRGMASATWPCLPAAFDHAIALSAVSPDELLAVLVHPPTPTDPGDQRLFDLYPDLWIRAVQAFTCLGIAHHRGDEPWPGSVRRGILSDLLFGPEDWVTEAAGFALVATAWAAPETREDVGRLIVERLTEAARAYQTREVTILGSLCRLTLACPWMDAQFTALAKDVLASIARNEEGIGAQPAESSAASRPPEKEKRRKLFGKH
jgi:hypothetical protein